MRTAYLFFPLWLGYIWWWTRWCSAALVLPVEPLAAPFRSAVCCLSAGVVDFRDD